MNVVSDVARPQRGQALPVRAFHAEAVPLLLYNGAPWNADRAHIDPLYTRHVESHPAPDTAGSLLADGLAHRRTPWFGERGQQLSFKYANRRACRLGDALRSAGKVTSITRVKAEVPLDPAIRNPAGERTTPGTAVLRMGRC
jgi:hypothetical protein